ncbi:nuclear transport factor 2 family protein [Streptomyces sp. HNM0574]|uniref:nuclear transport factor 2 family protein n=1 Tax=Streptomyces sp. HNM0574 TaxID=2714954 RepID=UPI001469B61D|nr:nuclear transport factor 2 family protein [Streptomyces sp. HNM0574]NLU68770.1 nuclear transport factor 2 family protein [Streptomyces sp. HNM0574]
MLSLQEMSDRMEIQDLLVRYSHAVDTRQWDALDELFTPDAVIDYTAMGGVRGSLPEIKRFLASALADFPAFQHLIANTSITLHGNTATARTMCHNPLALPTDHTPGSTGVLYCGLWYHDTLTRTEAGWRIGERVEERSYVYAATSPAPGSTSAQDGGEPGAG